MKTRNGQGFLPHALALSLALHAFVLSGSSIVPVAGGVAKPLRASLRLPPDVPPLASVSEPSVTAKALSGTPNAVPPAPALAGASPDLPGAAGTPSPPAAQPASAVSEKSGPRGGNEVVLAPPSAPTSGGQAVPAAQFSAPAAVGSAGPDPDGLRSYRVALAREARRFKRYPREAQEAGWTGTAEVRVDVGDGGTARPPSLARSSGREMLDGAALAMVAAAVRSTAVPAALRGGSFSVVLPVSFELDD